MPFSNEGCNSENGSRSDFDFIDGYLTTWDNFAQGANESISQIRQDKARFESELALALLSGDKRAPARLVFYAVVQVGGSILCDSELGRACAHLLEPEVPVFTSKEGSDMYFAGDLYFWWQRHEPEFETFPLYTEWRQREFARDSVIPMYKAVTKNR